MTLLLAVMLGARAHGPAPAGLEVLAWDAVGCPDVPAGATPRLVRTNQGLAVHEGDGTYAFACPARWGDQELVLAVASPEGLEVVLAGGGGVFRSADGTCTAEAVAVPDDETPVDLVWHDGRVLLATRSFSAGTGSLWAIETDGPSRLGRWDDAFPDSLWSGPDGLWVAGARPTPFVARFAEGALADRAPLPEVAGLDRLTLRDGDTDARFVVAGIGLDRVVWRVTAEDVVPVTPPAGVVHGPARVNGTWEAVVDGMRWTGGDAGTTWSARDVVVDWTCLERVHGRAYACTLPAVLALPDAVPAWGLEQVGPPRASCDGVDGRCALDWVHLAGESGLLGTRPAACPGAARTPEDTAIDTVDGPASAASPGCGCATGRPAWIWSVVLAGMVGRRRRTRPC